MSTVEQVPQQILNRTELLYKTGPKRQTTIELREFLRRLDTTKDKEAYISYTVGHALLQLRSADQKAYNSQYSRQDLVEGLGAIDHPEAQLVVIESLRDPAPNVVQAAQKVLMDPPKGYIHPEALQQLLDHEDPKVKEFGIRIIEDNPKGGITRNGDLVPGVLGTVNNMITLPSLRSERRGAILASLLHERTNGKMPEAEVVYAEDILWNYMRKRIDRLSEPNTFSELVTYISALNETSARTTANIDSLPLELPEQLKKDPEELEALMRLRPKGGKMQPRQIVIEYKSLVALTKERAREKLSTHVAQIKAQEEKRQQQLQAQTEEINRQRQLELQITQERQAQIRSQQRLFELALVQRAHQWFPHL